MPVKLERKLKAEAKARGYGAKRTGAFVYGTMRKTGWVPEREKKMAKIVAKRNRKLKGY